MSALEKPWHERKHYIRDETEMYPRHWYPRPKDDARPQRIARYGIALIAIALLLASISAHAAKQRVCWINPTKNADGTALIDLAFIRLEWGSCAGASFGAVQASILVPSPATCGAIYPTGLSTVCIRAYARNAKGTESVASNTVVKPLLPTTGKPVTLGQPIELPPE